MWFAMKPSNFTTRQQEVIDLLMQGKSNQQIALALNITERTVEDHLNHIYTMLEVSSRAEAIIQLGKSTVGKNSDPAVVSTVAENNEQQYSGDRRSDSTRKNIKIYKLIISLSVFGILTLATHFFQPKKAWVYEREAEFPDDFTTGIILDRSNALGTKVHGQFGSQSTSPWSAQPGYVLYNKINISQNGPLYLQIRYSKFSKSSVPILIYLDDEQNPRESLYPIDQGDWNIFTWTEWITLGEVTKGHHSIKFFTKGQEFGVADLDKFMLTTNPPE
jgi:DNA-binding CsgD family transcriptional regulator